MFIITIYIKSMLLLMKYTFKILTKTKLIYPFIFVILISKIVIFDVQISQIKLFYNFLLFISFIPFFRTIVSNLVKIFTFIKLKVFKRGAIYG